MNDISQVKIGIHLVFASLVLVLIGLLPGCAAGGTRGTGTTSFAGRVLSSSDTRSLVEKNSAGSVLERVDVVGLSVLVEALDSTNSVVADASTTTNSQGSFLVSIQSAERYRVTVQNEGVTGSTEVVAELFVESINRNVDVDFSLDDGGELEVLSVDISQPAPTPTPNATPTAQSSPGSTSSGSSSNPSEGSKGTSSPTPASSPTNGATTPTPTPSPNSNQESEGSGSTPTPTPSASPSPTSSSTPTPAASPSPSPGSTLVTICHVPGRNPQTLMVNENAVAGHLNHGDSLGPCPGDN